MLALITMFLSGCAGDVNMLPTLSKKSKISNEQGIVVVRVVNASSYPLPFNQVTITPKNVNESKKIKPSRLQAISSSTTNSTIFSAPVKGGSYALDSIRAFHIRGDYWYSRWAGADAKFGTFSVEPGKITDLGTIIYYPKPQEDKYLNTVLRTPETSPADVLTTYFPFYSFNENQVIQWTNDEFQDERDALFSSVAQNPVTFKMDYLAPDNSVYFIGKLGVILKRTQHKEWELDAIDTNLDLSAIVQSTSKELAVGGDEGVIFYKESEGEWQDISVAKTQKVEELYFNNKGALEAITREEDKLYIYEKQLSALDLPWSIKATFTSNQGWKDSEGKKLLTDVETKPKKKKASKAKRIVSVTTQRDDDKNIITLALQSMSSNFVFGGGDRVSYKFSPQTWQVSLYENDEKISRTFKAGATTLGIEYAGFWSLSGRPTYFKKDIATQEWKKIATAVKTCKEGYTASGKVCIADDGKRATIKQTSDSFSFTSIPWFSSNTKATAIASFSDYNFWSGKRSNETKIIQTNDGGATWQVTDLSLPNKFCTQIVSKVKDSLLLSCNGVSSDFYESNDHGETWQHVREQENF